MHKSNYPTLAQQFPKHIPLILFIHSRDWFWSCIFTADFKNSDEFNSYEMKITILSMEETHFLSQQQVEFLSHMSAYT